MIHGCKYIKIVEKCLRGKYMQFQQKYDRIFSGRKM